MYTPNSALMLFVMWLGLNIFFEVGFLWVKSYMEVEPKLVLQVTQPLTYSLLTSLVSEYVFGIDAYSQLKESPFWFPGP